MDHNGAVSHDPDQVRPRARAYLVPVVVFLAATTIAVVFLVNGFTGWKRTIDGLARVPVRGGGVVNFDEPGGYTIFYETTGAEPASVVLVAITRVADGRLVPVRGYDSGNSYNLNGREGTAIRTVRIPAAGRYRVRVEGVSVDEFSSASLAIGRNPNGVLARGIGLFVLVGGLGFVVGLVLSIVIGVKRGRSKRRIRAAQLGAAGGPAWAVAGPGGPPGYATPPGDGAPRPGYGVPAVAGAPGYGAPPPYATPPGYGPPPGYGAPPPYAAPPPGYGAPPGYSPPPGYAPPPGYGPPPGVGAQPAYGPPPGPTPPEGSSGASEATPWPGAPRSGPGSAGTDVPWAPPGPPRGVLRPEGDRGPGGDADPNGSTASPRD